MKFKDATDILFCGVGHADLAKSLQVSVASIRQARLAQTARAFREPPRGWKAEVRALAKKRAKELEKLADLLSEDGGIVLGIRSLGRK